jgi:hypothetical protein
LAPEYTSCAKKDAKCDPKKKLSGAAKPVTVVQPGKQCAPSENRMQVVAGGAPLLSIEWM